jgi:hypothetical protein
LAKTKKYFTGSKNKIKLQHKVLLKVRIHHYKNNQNLRYSKIKTKMNLAQMMNKLQSLENIISEK